MGNVNNITPVAHSVNVVLFYLQLSKVKCDLHGFRHLPCRDVQTDVKGSHLQQFLTVFDERQHFLSPSFVFQGLENLPITTHLQQEKSPEEHR